MRKKFVLKRCAPLKFEGFAERLKFDANAVWHET